MARTRDHLGSVGRRSQEATAGIGWSARAAPAAAADRKRPWKGPPDVVSHINSAILQVVRPSPEQDAPFEHNPPSSCFNNTAERSSRYSRSRAKTMMDSWEITA